MFVCESKYFFCFVKVLNERILHSTCQRPVCLKISRHLRSIPYKSASTNQIWFKPSPVSIHFVAYSVLNGFRSRKAHFCKTLHAQALNKTPHAQFNSGRILFVFIYFVPAYPQLNTICFVLFYYKWEKKLSFHLFSSR